MKELSCECFLSWRGHNELTCTCLGFTGCSACVSVCGLLRQNKLRPSVRVVPSDLSGVETLSPSSPLIVWKHTVWKEARDNPWKRCNHITVYSPSFLLWCVYVCVCIYVCVHGCVWFWGHTRVLQADLEHSLTTDTFNGESLGTKTVV